MNFNIREQITKSDADIEKALRPLVFADFNGQGKIVENLLVFVEAAKMRAESLDHVLLHGPPGLGNHSQRAWRGAEDDVGSRTRQAGRPGGAAHFA